MNNKGADQTAPMRRLICTFVVRIWQKQVFSWRGSHIVIKIAKIQIIQTQKNAVIILKFEQGGFTIDNVSKRCRRNSKQCRPLSDCSLRISLIWVYTVCPDLSVRKLWFIMVYSIYSHNKDPEQTIVKGCLGWSGPLLLASDKNRFCHDAVHLNLWN